MDRKLSIEERVKIASRFEVWKSVVQVQRWWRAENGRNAYLSPNTIKNCHQKLLHTGSVSDSVRSGRHKTSLSNDNIEIVRGIFERSPSTSIRKAARESNLTFYSVRNVLRKELNFRPWKPNFVQELYLEDCDNRMEFSENMLQWAEEDASLWNNVLWSDEAVFHVGGFINRHNCHFWSNDKPGYTIEKMQSRPKVTVWCGFTKDKFIGPYLLRQTMNGDRYLEMLRNYVWPVVSEWEGAERIIFMQDGAPPHFHLDVRAWLNATFPNKWIGRGGPQFWPARSPDLTPCDFFLWGWAKEQVYKAKPKTLCDLERLIQQVFENIPNEFMRKAVEDVPKRLRKCIENTGCYVEI